MPDHYTYPGTEVLVNRLGITGPLEWKRVETAAIGQRLVEVMHHPLPGRFDLDHLGTIHRHLVQDLCTWGGRLRDTDTDWLRDRDADAFSEGLAWAWGETTALHPFRDVNTRSQFVLFTQLAEQAGWVIAWSLIDVVLFAHARTVAISRDESGIDALIFPALLSARDARRRDEARDRAAGFFDGRRRASPSALDRELEAAIRRRNATRPDV